MGKELGAKSQEAVGPNLALAVQSHPTQHEEAQHQLTTVTKCRNTRCQLPESRRNFVEILSENCHNMGLLQYCFKVLLLGCLVQSRDGQKNSASRRESRIELLGLLELSHLSRHAADTIAPSQLY